MLALRKRSRTGPDAHAHSPRDRIGSRRSTISTCTTTVAPRDLMIDKSMLPPAVPDRDLGVSPDWNTPMNLPDPFIDSGVGRRDHSFGRRFGSEDLSMPDYSTAITPPGSHNMLGMNTASQRAAVSMGPTAHVQSETVGNATTIRKDGTSGTFVPGDDRRDSNVASDTSNVVSKASAAAEAKVASRPQRHGRRLFLKGPAKLTNRKKADVGMTSRLSEDASESHDMLDDQVPTKPAGSIKGKKEGRGNEIEAKAPPSSTGQNALLKKENARMADAARATMSAEGKRKRDLTVSENAVPTKAREVHSSPTKKTSRKVSQGGRSATAAEDLVVDDGAANAPLKVLENVL